MKVKVEARRMSAAHTMHAGKVIVTVVLDAAPETYRRIKAEVEHWTGAAPEQQQMLAGSLGPDRALGDRKFKKGAVIRLLVEPASTKIRPYLRLRQPLEVFCNPLTTPMFLMDVCMFDTVDEVKALIAAAEGIPLVHRRLLYNGLEMDDARTLAHYDVDPGSVLSLDAPPEAFPSSSSQASVCIKIPGGKLWFEKVSLGDSVESLRRAIRSRGDVFLFRLSFGGRDLEDHRMLFDYGVGSGSMIHLEPLVQIFVQLFAGKTQTLELELKDTIGALKTMIEDGQGTPSHVQLLSFRGVHCADSSTLRACGVQNESTIDLDFA